MSGFIKALAATVATILLSSSAVAGDNAASNQADAVAKNVNNVSSGKPTSPDPIRLTDNEPHITFYFSEAQFELNERCGLGRTVFDNGSGPVLFTKRANPGDTDSSYGYVVGIELNKTVIQQLPSRSVISAAPCLDSPSGTR